MPSSVDEGTANPLLPLVVVFTARITYVQLLAPSREYWPAGQVNCVALIAPPMQYEPAVHAAVQDEVVSPVVLP